LSQIELRGVRVHNLKDVDLDIPHGQLIVVCGVSGSGKTSLALDTLYAEGQRRYIESFSAYTRQFLERLEKPSAERIDGVSPAIAVTRSSAPRNHRATVGGATEIADYLRLLFSKIGEVFCTHCGAAVLQDSPQIVAERINRLPEGERFMLAFPRAVESAEDLLDCVRQLREEGFLRAAAAEQMLDLTVDPSGPITDKSLLVIVDRLTAPVEETRLIDSLETAFAQGEGAAAMLTVSGSPGDSPLLIDGREWRLTRFSESLRCDACELDYPQQEPRLYNFNSPLGACVACNGLGVVSQIDSDLVAPIPQKSLGEGAVAPFNLAAYASEKQALLTFAQVSAIPIDIPFRELSEEQRRRIMAGDPAAEYSGVLGFFTQLEDRKSTAKLRSFINRYKSDHPCPDCGGARLNQQALATQVAGKTIAEFCRMSVEESLAFFSVFQLTENQQPVAAGLVSQLQARLTYLCSVGLGYITLDRSLRSLSGGESQRVALTSALGSSLVNMLYVLDEPSVGLHPRDMPPLLSAIESLTRRGNTVVAVEHEEELILAADQVIEIGPGAGSHGGEVVFQGRPGDMHDEPESVTGAFLARRRGVATPERRRPPTRGKVILRGARGRNLQNLTVEFPLGLLCLVTGVSGAGKSTLVQDTLYNALCQRFDKPGERPLPYDAVVGDGQIDDVMLVDQSPIGRSPRSNPVTYIKAFDGIRNVFADTLDARTHNYRASHFSFNVDGGRCEECKGDGHIAIDMQFLADVYMRCPQCRGARYRKEILAVKYRGRNISEVLEMTVRDAFSFFRGQPKVQAKLKQLIDVGLEYLTLGQGANTLSTGEAQRLKLASYMSAASRARTLFLLDEPTTGLHFADVVRLLDCFDALLAVGHSLIVVEHNLQLMKSSDHIIDMGPGPAAQGGQVVFQGTPEDATECKESVTGVYLKESFSH